VTDRREHLDERRSALLHGKRLGRHIWHDDRSKAYRAPLASEVRSVRHQRHIPILDQGQLGSCTGNAMVGGLGCTPVWEPMRRFPTPPDLDQRLAVDIYGDATLLDGVPGAWPPEDTGSSGLAVCKAAKARGLIGGYQWAFGLEETLRAACLSPVLLGATWYSSFDCPSDDGEVWIHRAAFPRGGHEVLITEVDAARERVWIDNSWGPEWGVDGRAWMSWETLGLLLDDRGDAVVPTPLDVDVYPQVAVDVAAWWRRVWLDLLKWLGVRS
jgi:hypothetical protein